MNQLKQILRAASAAVAFGTFVHVQALPADSVARHAGIFHGTTTDRLKSLADGGGAGDGSRSNPRMDVAPGAAGRDWRGLRWAPIYTQARANPEMPAECAGLSICADKILEKAMRPRAPRSDAALKIAEFVPSAWGAIYDKPPSAFAIPAGLSESTTTLLPDPRANATEVQPIPASLRSALFACTSLLLAYSAYLATLALLQRRFVFNPARAEGPATEPAGTHKITSVRLALARDKAIKGWFLRPRQGNAPFPSIIYYGGRSEEVSWLRGAVKWFPNHAVLALNYRGYGESEGEPSEHALFEDGLAQFDWLAAQPGVDPNAIVLVGRSLGTGVASYVAAKRPAERVVLITPYDSLLALARRRFRFTPLSLLLRHKFKSVEYAKTNMQPCLALLAEHDDVVPEEHTHRLMACWAGAKKLIRIPSTTHLNIPYQAATLTAVATWLGYATVPPGPLSLIVRAT
jgi:acetyl esterase/lipase